MDNLSRRGLLTGAGALVAAGTLGVPAATARTLSLPTSKRFQMSATTNEFFRSKPLQDATVMQSFAFGPRMTLRACEPLPTDSRSVRLDSEMDTGALQPVHPPGLVCRSRRPKAK